MLGHIVEHSPSLHMMLQTVEKGDMNLEEKLIIEVLAGGGKVCVIFSSLCLPFVYVSASSFSFFQYLGRKLICMTLEILFHMHCFSIFQLSYYN